MLDRERQKGIISVERDKIGQNSFDSRAVVGKEAEATTGESAEARKVGSDKVR